MVEIRNIKERLSKIEGGVEKLLWGAGLVLLAAVVNFIVKGGLAG